MSEYSNSHNGSTCGEEKEQSGEVNSELFIEVSEDSNSGLSDEGNEGCVGSPGRSTPGQSESEELRCDRFFNDLRSGLQKVSGGPRGGYQLMSGVIGDQPEPNTDVETAIEQFIKGGRNVEIKILVKHSGHYHIIHECPKSNGTCRCFGPTFTRLHTTRNSRTNVLKTIGEAELENLLQYHLQSDRCAIYLQIGAGTGPRLLGRYKDLGFYKIGKVSGSAVQGSPGYVAICRSENEVLWENAKRPAPLSTTSECGDYVEEFDRPQEKKRRGIRLNREEEECEEALKLFINICASPLTDGDRTKPWTDSNFKFKNDLHFKIKNTKNLLSVQFSNKSLRDYKTFYANRTCHPLWGAKSLEDFDNVYFDKDTSVYKALQLLIHQTTSGALLSNNEIDDNNDIKWKANVFNYLRDLILFLDKKTGKQNTQYYISPSCSGKTFFFDMIRDYLLLHGNMTNWNRSCQFPFQMCVDKRIIFWNEPNIEQAMLEDFKKVAGGEYYSANIKNKSHTEIKRTPLIMTGNPPYILPQKAEWTCRVKNYSWSHAPFLIDNGSKRLHPLAFSVLIDMCENYFEEELI